MRVLRDNKESLMAVLEAFVYDPLISWRLLYQNQEKGADRTTDMVGAAANPQGPQRRMKADENVIFDGTSHLCAIE